MAANIGRAPLQSRDQWSRPGPKPRPVVAPRSKAATSGRGALKFGSRFAPQLSQIPSRQQLPPAARAQVEGHLSVSRRRLALCDTASLCAHGDPCESLCLLNFQRSRRCRTIAAALGARGGPLDCSEKWGRFATCPASPASCPPTTDRPAASHTAWAFPSTLYTFCSLSDNLRAHPSPQLPPRLHFRLPPHSATTSPPRIPNGLVWSILNRHSRPAHRLNRAT
jgi:hypothetical protein